MRRKPGNRRATETFDFRFQGHKYYVSFGRYANGNISEVFITTGPVGSPLEAMSRDLGYAVTIMLQNGILLSDIHGILSTLDDGSPAGPLGELIKRMKEIW